MTDTVLDLSGNGAGILLTDIRKYLDESGRLCGNLFGLDPNSQDNYTYFQNVLNVGSRFGIRNMVLSPGVYNFQSQTLLQRDAFDVQSNMHIMGVDKKAVTLQVVRTAGFPSYNQIFKGTDKSGIKLSNMTLRGHGVVDPLATLANSMFAYQLSGAAADCEWLEFEDLIIENFSGQSWLSIIANKAGKKIKHIRMRNCDFNSFLGNYTNAAINIPSEMIRIAGVLDEVQDVQMKGMNFDARYVKNGMSLVGAINGGSIHVDRLLDAGVNNGLTNVDSSAGSSGAGAYGFEIYQNATGPSRNLDIRVNELLNPFSNGVYLVGGRNCSIEVERGTGQRDMYENSIPKGLVTLLACQNIYAKINNVDDCNRVVTIAHGNDPTPQNTNITVEVNNVTLRDDANVNVAGGEYTSGLRITAPSVALAGGGITVRGYMIGAATYGTVLVANDTKKIQNINGTKLRVYGAKTALAIVGTAAVPLFDNINFDGAELNGTVNGISVPDGLGCTNMSFIKTLVSGPATGNLVNIQNGRGFRMDWRLRNHTATPALALNGTQGTLEVSEQTGITTLYATTGTPIGHVVPTWVGSKFDRVKNLQAAPTAGAGITYTSHWEYFAAWRPVIATVNA